MSQCKSGHQTTLNERPNLIAQGRTRRYLLCNVEVQTTKRPITCQKTSIGTCHVQTRRQFSASWQTMPLAQPSQPSSSATLSTLATSHATLHSILHRLFFCFNHHPPSYLCTAFLSQNPSPEKRTPTAFYVRLDRKPQVLRYVKRPPAATSGPAPRLDSVLCCSSLSTCCLRDVLVYS